MEEITYQIEDGSTIVTVIVDNVTIWLNLLQLAELFEKDKSFISVHISNIFESQELPRNTTVAKFATVQIEDTKKISREVEYYNLDMAISLGYRVNPKRGIQFRRWATQVLQNYLLKRYLVNQERITSQISMDEKKFDLIATTNSLIKSYSNTWSLLLQYDENTLSVSKGKDSIDKILGIESAYKAILNLKQELFTIGAASELFGLERSNGLKSILGSIDQTFDKKAVYSTAEMRAAHLLYFIIKDHPFVDGNKRIGCLLFILYLRINNIALDKITDFSLTALALLVAESAATEKEIIIKLIINLIT